MRWLPRLYGARARAIRPSVRHSRLCCCAGVLLVRFVCVIAGSHCSNFSFFFFFITSRSLVLSCCRYLMLSFLVFHYPFSICLFGVASASLLSQRSMCSPSACASGCFAHGASPGPVIATEMVTVVVTRSLAFAVQVIARFLASTISTFCGC